jgi:hypothetical protein
MIAEGSSIDQGGDHPRVAFVGSFAGDLVLDGRTFSQPIEGIDSLVATFDLADGRLAWAEQWNTPLDATRGGNLLFVDELRNQLLVTGVFGYTLDLGFKTITGVDVSPEAFAAKLLLPP